MTGQIMNYTKNTNLPCDSFLGCVSSMKFSQSLDHLFYVSVVIAASPSVHGHVLSVHQRVGKSERSHSELVQLAKAQCLVWH